MITGGNVDAGAFPSMPSLLASLSSCEDALIRLGSGAVPAKEVFGVLLPGEIRDG